MKKFLSLILSSLFLIVFNVCFFWLGGFEHPVSVWIAYGFIHFAYLMLALTPVFAGKSKEAYTYSFVLGNISSAYFGVEFIVGLIFIFVRAESPKASLIVQMIIAAIYLAVFITNLLANMSTPDRKDEIFYIKDCASRVQMLVGRTGDRSVDTALQGVCDTINASPIKTHASVQTVEAQIYDEIGQLEELVDGGDAAAILAKCRKITSLTQERNRRLRLAN